MRRDELNEFAPSHECRRRAVSISETECSLK